MIPLEGIAKPQWHPYYIIVAGEWAPCGPGVCLSIFATLHCMLVIGSLVRGKPYLSISLLNSFQKQAKIIR